MPRRHRPSRQNPDCLEKGMAAYQALPLTVGILAACISLRATARLCLATAILSAVLPWPLNYLWWEWLGWL